MNTPTLIPTDETLMQHISETLIELGISQKYKGFTYVKDVIFIWMNIPIEKQNNFISVTNIFVQSPIRFTYTIIHLKR